MKDKVITAIDIGSSKTVTIIGQVVDGSDSINVVGAYSTPSAGVRKGQIVDIEEAANVVVRCVEAAERMAGFSVNKVLVSVSGSHIASQNSHGVVAVSRPTEEIGSEDVRRVIEAARAVSLPSTREILHVVPQTYTVDSQEGVADPVGMSGIRLEVETHIITGATTALKNIAKCVSELGVTIDGLVFSGIAAAEAVVTETEKELGVVLVDIGGGTISILVFCEGSPVYTSVLPIGARNVTNDLAIGLRLSLDSAEKLKIGLTDWENAKTKRGDEATTLDDKDDIDLTKFGINEETRKVSHKTLVDGIIRPRLQEIFTMVGLEIQKSGYSGLTPAGIIITGGGSLTVGAADACRKALALPVRIGAPTHITGLIDDIMSPAFATPVGLLSYGLTNQADTSGRGLSLPDFGKIRSSMPLKGAAQKISSFIKSFLP